VQHDKKAVRRGKEGATPRKAAATSKAAPHAAGARKDATPPTSVFAKHSKSLFNAINAKPKSLGS
jgi:hypothetical protein